MEKTSKDPFEIAAAVFCLLLSIVVLWEARDIPPGVFEPLGAAAIPRAVAAIVLILSAMILFRALSSNKSSEPNVDSKVFVLSYGRAAMLFLLTIGYLASLIGGIVSYAISTAAFLAFACGLLTKFNPKGFAIGLALGAVLGLGLQYVFTKVFVIDLPLG